MLFLINTFGFSNGSKPTVAVVSFKNTTNSIAWDWLQEGIAEVVSGKISASGSVIAIERSQFSKILDEMKLTQTGLIDKMAQVRFGQMLGAQFLVLGSFQYSNTKIMITARIVNTETGINVAGYNAIGSENDIFTLQLRLADTIVRGLVPAKMGAKVAIPIMDYESKSGINIFRNLEKARILAQPLVNNLDLDPLRGRDAAKYLQGIDYVEQITQTIPNHAEANMYAGLFYEQLDKPEESEKYLDQAVKDNPNSATAFFHLGNVYRRQGKPQNALPCYDKAISLDMAYAESYLGRALLGDQSTRPLEVLRNTVKALYYKPTLQKADLMLRSLVRGDLADMNAETYLKNFLLGNPDDPEANFAYGYLKALSGSIEQAGIYLERSLKQYPDLSVANYYLGLYYVKNHDQDKARSAFENAVSKFPLYSEANLELAKLLDAGGEYKRALVHYQRFIISSQDAKLFPQIRDRISTLALQVGPSVDTIAIAPRPPPIPPKPDVKVELPPQLSYEAKFIDADLDGIFEGGEKIIIEIIIQNTGKGKASNVSVQFSGSSSLLRYISSAKNVGDIAPQETKRETMETVLPNQIETEKNKNVIVSVNEARGFGPSKKQEFLIALTPAPAEIVTNQTYVDVDIVPSRKISRDDVYAVIIGINKYREPNIPEVKYALRDAQKVKEYLENVSGVSPVNCFTLYDDRATMADFMDILEDKLPKKIKPNSTLFIYYAGHGTPAENGNGLLVPYDGRLGSDKTLYPLKKLYEIVNNLPIKESIIMIDACFSGGGRSVLAQGKRPLTLAKIKPEASSKVIVLAASKAEQTSNDYDKVKHGLFTYYLLAGMSGQADANGDGSLELGELFQFVSNEVKQTAKVELFCDQEPTLMPEEILVDISNVKIGKIK